MPSSYNFHSFPLSARSSSWFASFLSILSCNPAILSCRSFFSLIVSLSSSSSSFFTSSHLRLPAVLRRKWDRLLLVDMFFDDWKMFINSGRALILNDFILILCFTLSESLLSINLWNSSWHKVLITFHIQFLFGVLSYS